MTLLMGISGYAQVFVQNTMYSFNRYLYNPAAAGITAPANFEGGANLTLLGRLQWMGVDGGPNLFGAMFTAPLESISSGIGVYAIRDELGPLASTGLNVSYAFHMPLGDEDTGPMLSIGAAGGLHQKSLNGNFIYNPQNGEDPLVPLGNFSNSTMVPNLSAGLYLTWPEDKFFVGISGHDLLEPDIEDLLLTSGVGQDSKIPRSFYVMSGYTFNVTSDLTLQPTTLIRTDGVSTQFDISVNGVLNDLFMFGVSHRWEDSFSGMFGMRVSERSFIGYSYDYTTSGINANNDLNTHELILSYTFPGGGKNSPTIQNVQDKPGGIR